MIGRGLNGSAIKYYLAASPAAIGAAGSSDPVWFGDFDSLTLLVTTGSLSDADAEVHVMRSATSDGTFQSFGASVAAAATNKIYIRHFPNQSSAAWYKVYYAPGGGSDTLSVVLMGQGAGRVPVEQHSTAVVLSDVPV